MYTPYVFRPGHRAHITKSPEDEVLYKDGDIGFDHECDLLPTEDQGRVMADALNVHEATGLTPSQLQARVAELEAALRDICAYVDDCLSSAKGSSALDDKMIDRALNGVRTTRP